MQFSFFISLLSLTVFFSTVVHVNADAATYALISAYSSIRFEDYKKYLTCYRNALDIYEEKGIVDSNNPNLNCVRDFSKKYPQILVGDSLENLTIKDKLTTKNFKILKSKLYWQHYMMPYKMSLKQFSVISSAKLTPSQKLNLLDSYLKTVPERVKQAFVALIRNEVTAAEDDENYLITASATLLGILEASESDIAEFKSVVEENKAFMKKSNANFLSVSSLWFLAAFASFFLF